MCNNGVTFDASEMQQPGIEDSWPSVGDDSEMVSTVNRAEMATSTTPDGLMESHLRDVVGQLASEKETCHQLEVENAKLRGTDQGHVQQAKMLRHILPRQFQAGV